MKKLTLALLSSLALAAVAYAGEETYSSSGKDFSQTAVQQQEPQWYADREFNLSLWGTYAFTGNEYREDRYLDADHAFGGGVDAKYFFMRYFGVGVEGYALDAEDVAGSVLGNLTFRYPIPNSRFAPYVYAGGGVIFNGSRIEDSFDNNGILVRSVRDNSDAEGIGNLGGGIEIRLTPHIGLIHDFSWNVVNGTDNNFGMVRAGVNFAF